MIRLRQNRHSKSRQRGVALIAALITLLLIAAITAGMIILSTTETNTSANFRDEQRAFFSAKAGIEEVRDRLRTGATDTLRAAGTLPTTLPGGANSALYILNPANGESVAPWAGNYPDEEICKETTALGCTNGLPNGGAWHTSVLASTAYAPAAPAPVLDWKWVRITLKQNNTLAPYYTNGTNANTNQVCWNGTNEYADPTAGCAAPNLPVYILTALAVTPSGSRRMVQTEVVEDKINFTSPSALTLDGTGDLFAPGASGNWGVDGTDHAGCGVTTLGPPVHSIGVPDNADVVPIVTSIQGPPNRSGNYPGQTASPDVANISATMPPNLQTVSSLQNLMTTVKNNSTQPVLYCPTGCSGLSTPGDVTAPQIIYVNGNLSLSGNITGYGILAVTGSLTISGNVTWNGLVLVIGQGIFQTDGTPTYNGAIVVAKTLDPLGNPLPSVGPGSATFNTNGGGNGGVNYSSGCITQATTLSTFHVVAIRELMN
jgi:hypothetical protein